MEGMRIDFAHTIVGLRVNAWMSIVAILVSAGFIVRGRRTEPIQVPTIGAGPPSSRELEGGASEVGNKEASTTSAD